MMTQVVIGAACMTQEALHSPVLLRAGSQRRKPRRSGRSTDRATGRSCSGGLRPPPGLSWPDIHAISSMRVFSMPWFGEGKVCVTWDPLNLLTCAAPSMLDEAVNSVRVAVGFAVSPAHTQGSSVGARTSRSGGLAYRSAQRAGQLRPLPA